MTYYKRPEWFVRKVANPSLRFTVEKLGIGPERTRVFEVKGRKTGQPRHVPINILKRDGKTYLVAPRGETEWVRNVRAAGEAVLLRKGDRTPITVEEVPVAERAPIIQQYVRENATSTKGQFDVSGPDAPIADFERIAPNHPVFRYTEVK